VLTAEFKINLLKPASGALPWCRAEVLRAGRQLHIVESRVYVGTPEVLEASGMVAVALVTLAVVDAP
jgi:acyl-coenzyme A thioesterase PaaI-like protein